MSGPDFPVFLRDKETLVKDSGYFYGCVHKDKYLLHHPDSLPRYGYLARKLLRHYAGDHYNPHTIPPAIEQHMRELIKGLMEYKVMYRTKGYDWEWIDHFFKKVVADYFNLKLSYDLARIEQGFSPACTASMLVDYGRQN